MSEHCIQIRKAGKNFTAAHGRIPVLRNFNLDIKTGELVCIVGPSGCGKTTLLNLIAGLDRPDEGQVLHNGNPVNHVDPQRIVIFQELGLFPWLTVRENVEFGLKAKGLKPDERRQLSEHFLRMVRLWNFRDACIHELSGGMKQRVAFARALVLDPEVLLMDEPLTALDAQTRDALHLEIQRIWKETGKTIIFVTHNVREAVCLGNRVVVLSAPPTTIKRVYDVDLPRPRQIEDPGIIEIVREVLRNLKAEIDRVKKEENDAG